MVAFGKSSGGGRRTGKREAAPLAAVLTTRSRTFRGILVDVSSTGARIRGDDLPKVEDEAVLGVEKIRAFGTIRWNDGHDCGIEFERDLLHHEVVDLRREVARGAGLPPELKQALDDWIIGVAR
jgi:hypothetical protein